MQFTTFRLKIAIFQGSIRKLGQWINYGYVDFCSNREKTQTKLMFGRRSHNTHAQSFIVAQNYATTINRHCHSCTLMADLWPDLTAGERKLHLQRKHSQNTQQLLFLFNRHPILCLTKCAL